MLKNDYTKLFLELEDVNIFNVKKEQNTTIVSLIVNKKEQTCPRCNSNNTKIHDYRTQLVKDVPFLNRPLYLEIKKRRYCCKDCKKRFYEDIPFLPKYQRTTNRLWALVIELLASSKSMSQIAKETNLSSTSIARILDHISYKRTTLPSIIAIDEFRGNSGGEKFQTIITNPKKGIVLDILQSRKAEDLYAYFGKFKNRNDVKLIVMECKNFKHSRKLLLKNQAHLSQDEILKVSIILEQSKPLAEAYYLKNEFYKLIKSQSGEEAKKLLSQWFMKSFVADLPEFEFATKAFSNWYQEIINIFKYNLSNGFTEGCNNKIKVLKRVSYGMRNFNRFRTRILHIFNKNFA